MRSANWTSAPTALEPVIDRWLSRSRPAFEDFWGQTEFSTICSRNSVSVSGSTRLSGHILKDMSRMAVLFFVLSGIASAQTPVQLDFGVRGGVLANDTFQENQLCSGAGCVLATHSFSSEGLRGTLGPTVGVLLYDRIEVRFEAVHRRFGYEIKSDVMNPIVMQHARETVRGHLWEYPLIAAYHFGSGTVRPYTGGGLGLGANGHYTAGFFNESTLQLASGPVTTTSFDQRSADLFGLPTGYYVVGGMDGRISYLSIRPEFRYTHFPKDRGSTADVILNPNQFEFLIGISLHPFRVKK